MTEPRPMRIDTSVLKEMKGYGAFDINACFNCGNCTAICPLSKDNVAFPRRVIRYAQLGQTAHLAASPEVWLCYYCAECSETCPRQADPGGFMAAARRFAIATFDPTSLARRAHRSKTLAAGLLIIISVALLGALLAASPGLPPGPVSSQTLLQFVPFASLHWIGLGVATAVLIIMAATLVNMFWMISRAPVPGGQGLRDVRPESFPLIAALRAARTTLVELISQRRYRGCDADGTRTAPWPLQQWFIHYAIMLAMVGLGAATALDYLLKPPGSHVALWYPMRLLGTCAGLLLMYGTSAAMVQRLRKHDKYHSLTLLSDWLLLVLLWMIGLSGFVLELAEYVPLGSWVAAVFLGHIVVALDLILLLPFTKLAHIVYRPAAIWFTEFRRLRAIVH